MDGNGLSIAAKAVLTVCFLGFMIFYCLNRLLIALAVLFAGIIGFILLTALQIWLENREQRHFIRNILPEYGKIINEDQGDYKKRGLAFLEKELEYSQTHSRLACKKNILVSCLRLITEVLKKWINAPSILIWSIPRS
ncbi:MAG: hypothetical protein SOZ56_05565 [Oscillospiraceae bacterium]|nr:hypothetical protein [Oscillospiraceae bacterium]